MLGNIIAQVNNSPEIGFCLTLKVAARSSGGRIGTGREIRSAGGGKSYIYALAAHPLGFVG
jgi:hypothetical protein